MFIPFIVKYYTIISKKNHQKKAHSLVIILTYIYIIETIVNYQLLEKN